MIFWAGFVQICEVYAHSPLSTLLFYYYGIGQPLGIKNLLHSPSLFELHYLILDSIRMILGWALRSCFWGWQMGWHSNDDKWSSDPPLELRKHSMRTHRRSPWENLSTLSSPVEAAKLRPEKTSLNHPHNNLLQILAFHLFGQPIGEWHWGLWLLWAPLSKGRGLSVQPMQNDGHQALPNQGLTPNKLFDLVPRWIFHLQM